MLAAIFCGSAKGQKISIAGSSEAEQFIRLGKVPVELRNVVPVANGYAGLYLTKVRSRGFGGAAGVGEETSQLLRLYDQTMRLKKEQELLDGKDEPKAFDLISSDEKLYFLYTTREKRTLSLFYKEIDPATLAPIKQASKLGELDFLEDQAYDNAQTLMSSDSSKRLFHIQHWAKKKDIQSVRYVVVDKSMSKMYERSYSFPYTGKEMRINHSFLGNDGSFYILYSYYPGGDHEIERGSAGSTIPSELHLKIISKDRDQDISISTNGVLTEMARVVPIEDNMIAVTGLYKTNRKSPAEGVFIAKLKAGDKSQSIKTTPFPDSIKSTIKAKADFTKETNSFMEYTPAESKKDPVQISTAGKEIFMFNQYHYPKRMQDENQSELNSDVYLTVFKAGGDVVFRRIALGEDAFRVLPARSEKSIFLNNKLIFLTSNAQFGSSKRGFGTLVFDMDGNILDKKLISNDDDLDGYWLMDDEIKVVSERDYLVPGISGGKRKLFKISIGE